IPDEIGIVSVVLDGLRLGLRREFPEVVDLELLFAHAQTGTLRHQRGVQTVSPRLDVFRPRMFVTPAASSPASTAIPRTMMTLSSLPVRLGCFSAPPSAGGFSCCWPIMGGGGGAKAGAAGGSGWKLPLPKAGTAYMNPLRSIFLTRLWAGSPFFHDRLP